MGSEMVAPSSADTLQNANFSQSIFMHVSISVYLECQKTCQHGMRHVNHQL